MRCPFCGTRLEDWSVLDDDGGVLYVDKYCSGCKRGFGEGVVGIVG